MHQSKNSTFPVELILSILSFLDTIDMKDSHSFSRINHSWNRAMQCLHATLDKFPRTITFGFMGSSGSGKTCLMSRLLVDAGFIQYKTQHRSPKILPTSNQKQDMAATSDKDGDVDHYMQYAATFMDKTEEERALMKTIHVNRRSIFMDPDNSYSLIDTPGSIPYVKNCIRGMSQCNVAIIVVSAVAENFDTELRRIVGLAYIMSIHNYIVVINKMDLIPKEHTLTRFIDVKKQMDKCFAAVFPNPKFGVKTDQIPYIPVSSLTGMNVFQNTSELSWYPTTKFPSLWEQINRTNQQLRMNTFEDAVNRYFDSSYTSSIPSNIANASTTVPSYDPLTNFAYLKEQPFRMSINQCFRVPRVGIVACGTVLSGTIQLQKKVVIEPSGIKSTVKNLQVLKRNVSKVYPGDYASICLSGNFCIKSTKREKAEIYRGCVISKDTNPVFRVEEFTVRLVMVTPNSTKIIQPGWQPNVFSNTAYAQCKLVSIESAFEKTAVEKAIVKPKFLNKKQGGLVRFKALNPICLTTMDQCPRLARVIFRDGATDTVCVGLVQQINKYSSSGIGTGHATAVNQPSSSPAPPPTTRTPPPTTATPSGKKLFPLPFPRTKTTTDIWSHVKFRLDWWDATE